MFRRRRRYRGSRRYRRLGRRIRASRGGIRFQMQCQKPVTLKSGVTVNCGKCMACRINYTSAWKLRLLYELSNWDDACFVTLTYKDERVPVDYALHKKELSGFFKRLRAALDYEYGKHPIKFYACGNAADHVRRLVGIGLKNRHILHTHKTLQDVCHTHNLMRL